MANHYNKEKIYKNSKPTSNNETIKVPFLNTNENEKSFLGKILISYAKLKNSSKIIVIFLGLVISLSIINSIIKLIISLMTICLLLGSIYFFYFKFIKNKFLS